MRTIIAAYHDRGNAEAALTDVTASGYEATSANIYDEANAGRKFADSLMEENLPRDRADLYAEALRRGSFVLLVRAPDNQAEAIADIFDRHESLDLERGSQRWRSEGWTGYDANAAMLDEDTRRHEREQLQRETLEVIEEDVRIGKRAVPGQGVRIRTFVTEHPVRENVTLREERIDVSREAVDEPVSPGASDSTFTEQEYVVTTTSEEPVVQKEARVVERVNIQKEADTRTETVEETERRRDVEVESTEPEPTAPRPRH